MVGTVSAAIPSTPSPCAQMCTSVRHSVCDPGTWEERTLHLPLRAKRRPQQAYDVTAVFIASLLCARPWAEVCICVVILPHLI